MEKIFQVAVHYRDILGYIEYDSVEKKVNVELDAPEAKQAAEAFMRQKHEIRVPHETLRDFTTEVIDPLASEETFKLMLTRLWEATEVHVDWSRPVDYVIAHPRITD